MNIILLTPGIEKKFNDNYHAYFHLCSLGNKIIAITQPMNINKGGSVEISNEYEIQGNLEIYRIFETIKDQKSIISIIKNYSKIKKILSEFNPNIIICEEISNMILALILKKFFKIPIVLRVEFIFNENEPYRTMGKMLNKFKNKITGDYLSILLGKFIWKLAYKSSDSLISCYFGDLQSSISNCNNKFNYVPWPTANSIINSSNKRIKTRGIFIGALDAHKNLKELKITLPLIFSHTHVKEFLIIGYGDDIDTVNYLKDLYPKKIRHIRSLARDKCLELIGESFFSYSPATSGGWGFIGDSWAMKTPVVVTHNHYDFHDGIDSIVTNPHELVNKINMLYTDVNFFNKISNGGYAKFLDNYTAESVGVKFNNICKSVLIQAT